MMKNDKLKPGDYRWVKVKTGEELLMTEKELLELKDREKHTLITGEKPYDDGNAMQKSPG